MIAFGFKRLEHGHDLPLPSKATPGSSGWDVYAAIEESTVIASGHHALIPTGFCCNIPQGWEIQVRSRSGLALKNKVVVLNSPGTVDSDYRGEIQVILMNFGPDFIINRGDRIAQLVPVETPQVCAIEITELSGTERGSGGFGHTGIK